MNLLGRRGKHINWWELYLNASRNSHESFLCLRLLLRIKPAELWCFDRAQNSVALGRRTSKFENAPLIGYFGHIFVPCT